MSEPCATMPLPQEDPRVRFAAERTLLAWMRTSLALMGFGFVVARLGVFLREMAAADRVVSVQHGPSWSLWIGIALMVLGVAVGLTTSIEYYRFVCLSGRGRTYTPHTALFALATSVILGALGVLTALYLVWMSV